VAAIALTPVRRGSMTRRSCSVRFTRPLAWLEFAHRISTFSSDSARPSWVMPWPPCASWFATRNTPCLCEIKRYLAAMPFKVTPKRLGADLHTEPIGPLMVTPILAYG
jgi:hypothetical protein